MLINANNNKRHFTFIPSSQEIQRSPLVKKQATACLAKWCIQPSSLNWVIIASIQGNPVWPYFLKNNFLNNFFLFLWKIKNAPRIVYLLEFPILYISIHMYKFNKWNRISIFNIIYSYYNVICISQRIYIYIFICSNIFLYFYI